MAPNKDCRPSCEDLLQFPVLVRKLELRKRTRRFTFGDFSPFEEPRQSLKRNRPVNKSIDNLLTYHKRDPSPCGVLISPRILKQDEKSHNKFMQSPHLDDDVIM